MATHSASLNNPLHSIYEILPSLSHDNKGVKNLVDSFTTLFDTDKIFAKPKEVVGLEIYANEERISYHFVIPNSHEEYIVPKIKQTFKGSSLHKTHRDYDSVLSLPVHEGNDRKIRNTCHHRVVNLYLKNAAFLPLKMDDKASVFEEIVHSLENLRKGEEVVIQMLFQPVRNDWQEQFREAYEGWLSGENTIHGYGVKEMAQVLIKGLLNLFENFTRSLMNEEVKESKRRHSSNDVNKKLTQEGFKTCIRVLSKSNDESRPEQINRGITAAFRTLAHDNDFVARTPLFVGKTIKQMESLKMPKITINHQILCKSEVMTLMKIPDKGVEAEKLKRMAPEERQVSKAITKEGYLIGHTINSPNEPVHFSVNHGDDIARTRLFIASPGGGKSTLIEQFVLQAARYGHGCAIFDVADGRLYERIIRLLPEHKQDIICIDYTDKEFPPAFNFSALGGEDETRGLMFGEFFEQLFDTSDLARTQSYMLKAAMAVFSNPESTLLEFIEMLRNESFRKQMLPSLRKRQPDLYLWWTREFPKVGEKRLNEIIAPILVRLDTFLYNQRIRNILCQKGGKLTPAKWMEEGKIVVFNLSGGSFTEHEQRILMSLHNAAFWNATLARESDTRNNKEPRPFHLVYDEPQTYMGATPMFDRAISKARKYRVSCNFFIQDAEQIIKEAPDLWKKILGMSPHLMVGPVSESTAKHIYKEFNVTIEEILALKKRKYCWLLRTFHNKEALPPFVVKTMPPRDERETVDDSHIGEVKKKNRMTFNTLPLKELNDDIAARQMGMTLKEYQEALKVEEEPEGTDFEWSE